MKKTIRTLSGFIAVVILLLSIAGVGSAEGINYKKYNGFVYTDHEEPNGYVHIAFYKGDKKKVTVPTEIKGQKVSSIFRYGNIEYLHIPKGVDALYISRAKNLKKITVDKDHELYTVKNNLLLSKDKTVLYGCPRGNTTPKIPKTVKVFETHAFKGAKFKTFKIPKNVTTIGSYAFADCKKLTKITFNKKLKEIEGLAFSGCKSLKSVTLPNSVREMGSNAFANCIKLTQVYLSNKLTTVSGSAFYNCNSLKEIQIPSSVKLINNGALSSNKSLKKVYIYNKKCEIKYHEVTSFTAITPDVTIYGYKGSTAEEYAKQNGNKFVALK